MEPFLAFGDLEVMRFVQSYHAPWLTTAMKTITNVGSPAVLIPLTGLIAGSLYFTQRREVAMHIVLLSFGNILSPVLKLLLARPRPGDDIVAVLAHEPDFSMPSGHALSAVLFAAVIVTVWTTKNTLQRTTLCAALLIGILAIGLSRVYLGVHWLTDILAGYLVGGLWIALCAGGLWPKMRKRASPTLSR